MRVWSRWWFLSPPVILEENSGVRIGGGGGGRYFLPCLDDSPQHPLPLTLVLQQRPLLPLGLHLQIDYRSHNHARSNYPMMLKVREWREMGRMASMICRRKRKTASKRNEVK